LSDPMAALLKTRVDRLKADLKADFKDAGVDPSATLESFKNQLQAKNQDLKAAEFNENLMRIGYREALRGWLRDVGDPALFKRHDQDDTALLNLKLKQLSQPLDLSLVPQIKELELRTAKDRAEIYGYLQALEAPPPMPLRASFEAYTQTHGAHPPLDSYPKDIGTQYESAHARWRQDSQGLVAFRRLDTTLQATEALKAMISNHDTQAMNRYLGLLECENTAIGRAPKRGRK
jgi:hypothetical protein